MLLRALVLHKESNCTFLCHRKHDDGSSPGHRSALQKYLEQEHDFFFSRIASFSPTK